ncbi:MAG: nucleotidyl transferase AbiEii/AbiGii toxin family protein [Deferrisomatales bacterium]|nr:nucleotidyl transferase AbiEii/AbiGii toxin family protein [Deferrisomatales bacterium]
MIDRRELMDLVRELGLRANVVEKDYVLGWLLAGISNHPALSPSWVFKGGTCLKKCYFETYRFSEDLDFTLTDPKHLDQEFLVSTFHELAGWVYEEAGIECPVDTIRFEVYENPRGGVSATGKIGYRGPLQNRGDPPRVKFDLTIDEVLVLAPVPRRVHHPYSDLPAGGIEVVSYRFEEVFAEKVRALAERMRPRDLYDVIHLYRHDDMRPDRPLVLDTLGRKCAFKGIPVPTAEALRDRPERAELEAEWANMLAHQLPELPPFEQFWEELPAVFAWLHAAAEKLVPAPMPVGQGEDATWQPPVMAQTWHAAVPLEIIRFAAANRLCVDLGYQGRQRVIEPYSLRRTQDGNLLLHAVHHESGAPRAYRVDRIESAKATQIPFTPRYAVELTASGPVSAPPAARGGSVTAGAGVRPSQLRSARRSGRSMSSGPRYVIECPFCGKKFERKNPRPRLNPHKDKHGYPCAGRSGYLVDTKY